MSCIPVCTVSRCNRHALEIVLADLPQVPYRSRWLTGIGLAFFFLNLCLFVTNTALIAIRFRLRPGSFVDSFTDQMESLFISAFVGPARMSSIDVADRTPQLVSYVFLGCFPNRPTLTGHRLASRQFS